MQKTTMNLRIDSKLKQNAEKITNELGLSMASAITLYLKALVREKGIPFPVVVDGKKKSVSTRPVYKENVEDDLDSDPDGVIDQNSLKNAIDKL
jgi:DNA-damage-inducible protein J